MGAEDLELIFKSMPAVDLIKSHGGIHQLQEELRQRSYLKHGCSEESVASGSTSCASSREKKHSNPFTYMSYKVARQQRLVFPLAQDVRTKQVDPATLLAQEEPASSDSIVKQRTQVFPEEMLPDEHVLPQRRARVDEAVNGAEETRKPEKQQQHRKARLNSPGSRRSVSFDSVLAGRESFEPLEPPLSALQDRTQIIADAFRKHHEGIGKMDVARLRAAAREVGMDLDPEDLMFLEKYGPSVDTFCMVLEPKMQP